MLPFVMVLLLVHGVMTLRNRNVKSVDLSYAIPRVASIVLTPPFSHTKADEESQLSGVLVRFGQRLRAVRQEKGVSQEKLADLAGLHRTYVSSVERGQRNISLLNIERLASALGVKLVDLMP
jgi:ribosome-binding protein aMBF1 (putative translation factor)